MPQCNATWVDMPSSHKLTFKRITTAFMHYDKSLNIRLEALGEQQAEKINYEFGRKKTTGPEEKQD